jgi:predicted DNA-binding protein
MAVKATFVLDEVTARKLNEAARRLAKPKSEIVRESITEFYGRLGKLNEVERTTMLRAFDTLMANQIPRSRAETDAELAEIRAARRTGGRRSGKRS